MDRLRLATVWLGGCSGCHMSLLDLDEWLIDLAGLADVVYSPIMDVKDYPDNVDVCLVEGAVANKDHLEMAHRVRRATRMVVAFGDCAVTGNVTAMRNTLGSSVAVLNQAYLESAQVSPGLPVPSDILPALLDRVQPLHCVIAVDAFLQGCPPPASRIRPLLEGLMHSSLGARADAVPGAEPGAAVGAAAAAR
jgi:NAD-reducing hydrogenase small subunit